MAMLVYPMNAFLSECCDSYRPRWRGSDRGCCRRGRQCGPYLRGLLRRGDIFSEGWSSQDGSFPSVGDNLTLLAKSRVDEAESSMRNDEHADSKAVETGEKVREWKMDVPVAGFRPDSVRVSVDDGRVTVRAKSESHEAGCRQYREVSRVIALPADVDAARLRARFSAGRLLITAPPLKQITAAPHEQAGDYERSLSVEADVLAAPVPDTVSTVHTDATTTQADADTENDSNESNVMHSNDDDQIQQQSPPLTQPQTSTASDADDSHSAASNNASPATASDTAGETRDCPTLNDNDTRESGGESDPEFIEVTCDVSAYPADNIMVSVRDRTVTVRAEAQIGDEDDDSSDKDSLQYVHTFQLHERADTDKLRCSLSDEGVLSVRAPKLSTHIPESKEIHVEMQH